MPLGPLPLRCALCAAASAARLRRGLSTAASIPPWAIIHNTRLVNSPELSSGLLLAEPPRTSHLLVPAHLVNPQLHPDSTEKPMVAVLGGMVRATSGDGLLLIQCVDGTAAMGPSIAKLRAAGKIEFHLPNAMDPDVTRFVCNPVSCDLFRLPDIDGTRKVPPLSWHPQGLLTQSVRGHGPPDRYAVAELSVDGEGEEQSFVMRRFLSDTGEWEKLVGLPSPLPLPRRINLDHEVVAFGGRLYWVDLTWGAISADPFSDRPELRFLELPWDSVWPVPSTDQIAAQSMHRRMGASGGRLRYVELSQEDPFLLSSFALGSDGRSWTLEHQVVFSRIRACPGAKEVTRIGVIDPLNANVGHLLIGSCSLAVEMSWEGSSEVED
ncbi:unnamed protein product [Urochloa humidicola]